MPIMCTGAEREPILCKSCARRQRETIMCPRYAWRQREPILCPLFTWRQSDPILCPSCAWRQGTASERRKELGEGIEMGYKEERDRERQGKEGILKAIRIEAVR